MKSMTGYGSGSAPFSGGWVNVELRTVNHRFIEIKMPLPREFLPWESEFREMIEIYLKRGRVEMTLSCTGRLSRTYSVQPNLELARAYQHAVQRLCLELNLQENFNLSFLTVRQDLFQITEQNQTVTEEVPAAKEALLLALATLERQRTKEGKFLQQDFRQRISALEKKRKAIQTRSRVVQKISRQRLMERVSTFLQGVELDQTRLLQEVVTLTQKSDITEEIIRLQSHLKTLADLVCTHEPVGKRIEFLLQEVQREVNTIGAKSEDVTIRHAVVEAKEEVEKMREQVQNVE
jgi:uncharacterized protein (TIGR00255 family)